MINREKNYSNTQPIPTVSIIMNCLNCSKYLREAIDSVFAQTYTDWEIIFWDNASTDNSAEIAKGYGDKVRYFRSDKTYPLGKARNLAIEQARGKYIAFLDCDDIWLPKKLERQIPLFERNTRVGLVFCNTIFFNDRGVSYRIYGKKRPPKGYAFRDLLKRYYLANVAVIIRRDVLDDLNEWFDEKLDMVGDADLYLRIAHDYEIDYVDEPLAKWRMHEESLSFSKKELAPKQGELLMQKFCNIYEKFEKEYKEELLFMKAYIQYHYALLDWEKGKKKRVRERLYPYLGVSKRFWIPYILSFLPYKVYMRLVNLYRVSRSRFGIRAASKS